MRKRTFVVKIILAGHTGFEPAIFRMKTGCANRYANAPWDYITKLPNYCYTLPKMDRKRGKKLKKGEAELVARQMLAEANIGKIDIFNENSLESYYKENIEKHGYSPKQFHNMVAIAKHESRVGLDPEQLLATTVIRNVNTLDKIDSDLGLVDRHVGSCEQDLSKMEQENQAFEAEIAKKLADNEPIPPDDFKVLENMASNKQKLRNSLAGFIKMRSALYKNVSDIMKNQTDLNYKMAVIAEKKRANDLMEEKMKSDNPPATDAEFVYTDEDVENIEEIIKVKLAGQKHLLPGE